MSVVTRFAPSPTGYLHIGGARTALFSWLYARRHGGRFVLRIEDTDRERSTEESVQAILDGMEWLGLDWDDGPHFQTKRFDRYGEVLAQLLDEDKAYRCYCTRDELDEMREQQRAQGHKPKYDGRCRERSEPRDGVEPVIRFRSPTDGETVFDDLIRGRIATPNNELDDLIIARSDGTPTYNFTVVVDDWDMGITDVIRGDDHINNTPRQINILKALGAEVLRYAHVPMILGTDGKRLSKRHGAVSVMQFRDEGILPEALLNGLVRLGWSHGDQEIFSREEMIANFDLGVVQKSAAAFDPAKLQWLNEHYLRELPLSGVVAAFRQQAGEAGLEINDDVDLDTLVDVQRQRCKTVVEMMDASLFFFAEPEGYEEKAARKHFKGDAVERLREVRGQLGGLDQWLAEPIHNIIREVSEAAEVGMGKVAQPIRVAMTGTAVSPAIDITLQLLGREATLHRLDRAINWIESQNACGGQP